MDVPFSMATKVAEKLGYSPEEGSSGQMVMQLLDFIAVAGAHKAGVEGVKSMKDIGDKAQMTAELKAVDGMGEINLFADYAKNLKLSDIKEVAEKQDTPQAKEIVSKIDELEKSAEPKIRGEKSYLRD